MALSDRLQNLYHVPLRLRLRVPLFRPPFLGPQARPVLLQAPRLHLHGRSPVHLPTYRRAHRGLNQLPRRVLSPLLRLPFKTPGHPRNRNRPLDRKGLDLDATQF